MDQRGRAADRDEAQDAKPGGGRLLVICADDVGLHEGIDEACLELARRGRLSAVSCMCAAPAWPGSIVAELRRLPVDIGLHLDLTQHTVDARLKHSLPGVIGAAYMRRLPFAQVLAEIHAQLDRFEHAVGRAPDHIDGHQHVHQLPVVRDALAQAIASRYPGRSPWLRSTRAAPARGAPRFKPAVIDLLGRAALQGIATRLGARQNGHLIGVYGFDADARGYERLLSAWLDAASHGDLLMCHPCDSRGRAHDGDPILAARGVEFAVLSGPWFGQALAARGLEPGRLGDFAASARG